MGFGFDLLIIALLFFGKGAGPAHDLLSMISTDAYWDAKHVTVSVEQLENDAAPQKPAANMDTLIKDLESSEFKTRNSAKKQLIATGAPAIPFLIAVEKSSDPEVAATAIELVDELQLRSKEQDIRRLMAIRTLGERKEITALDELKGFTTSQDLFVAEYASRAIAQIQDKPYPSPDHKKELANDLKLIPQASAVVGQSAGLVQDSITVEDFVDGYSAASLANVPQANEPASPTKKNILEWTTGYFLKFAEQVGDLRFYGVTVSISEDAGEESGSAVIIIRGQYDEKAILTALKKSGNPNAGMKASQEGDADVLEDEDTAILLPSNQLFIIILGDKPSDRAPPRQSILAALKAGDAAKSALADNKDISALIATVDTSAPLWAVAKITDEIRKEKMFEAYKTITLTSKINKDKTEFTLTGEGVSEDKVKTSNADLDAQIQIMITQTKMEQAQIKSLASVIDLLESIKITSNGTTSLLTGEMKNTITQSMLVGVGPMLIGQIIEEHQIPHP